jgi:lipid II:glycine glycyltransferase (peptidoglycan interpeptide bridge formation enzyme)
MGILAFLNRGPVLAPGHEELGSELAVALDREARKRGWLYFVIDYAYAAGAFARMMQGVGFLGHPEGIPPSGLWAATVLLNLQGNEETLLAGCSASFRKLLRKALSSNLTFEPGAREDIDRFWSLMKATCARRGVSPTPSSADVFLRLWDCLYSRGGVQLFLVKDEGRIISAAFAFTLSDTVRVWKIGWEGESPDKNPNQFMWWKCIVWAQSHGYSSFDFVSLDEQDAHAYAKDGIKAKFRDGASFMKLRFGGQLVFLPRPASMFYHPVLRIFNTKAGRALLGSSWLRRWLSRKWGAR